MINVIKDVSVKTNVILPLLFDATLVFMWELEKYMFLVGQTQFHD